MLTEPDDPLVFEAMTRKCSVCKVQPGTPCVCALHNGAHPLSTCPTATGRFVHHGRLLPPPKGGD